MQIKLATSLRRIQSRPRCQAAAIKAVLMNGGADFAREIRYCVVCGLYRFGARCKERLQMLELKQTEKNFSRLSLVCIAKIGQFLTVAFQTISIFGDCNDSKRLIVKQPEYLGQTFMPRLMLTTAITDSLRCPSGSRLHIFFKLFCPVDETQRQFKSLRKKETLLQTTKAVSPIFVPSSSVRDGPSFLSQRMCHTGTQTRIRGEALTG